MQQCSNCGHRNRAGIVFCENCGASLIGKMPVDTKSLDSENEEQTRLAEETRQPEGDKPQGVSTFPPGSYLRLELEGSTEPILFQPKPETIFGRRDPATGAMPDIDLTPFAGYRMGVSRRHAAIRFGDERSLDLWDLGSSNGTFLNSQRLSAHRPYRLHDGDELRLGQMVIRLFFQVAETAEMMSPSAPAVTTKLSPEDLKPAGETPKLTTEATKPADEPEPEPAKPAPEPQAPAPTPAAEQPQPETPPLNETAPPEPEKPAAPPAEPAPAAAEEASPAEPAPEKPAEAPVESAAKPASDAPAQPEPDKPPAAPAEDATTAPEPGAQPSAAPAQKPADTAPPAPEEPKLLEDKAEPEAPRLAPGAKPAGELPKPAEADAKPEKPSTSRAGTKPLPPEPTNPQAEKADKPADGNVPSAPVSEPEPAPEPNEKHD